MQVGVEGRDGKMDALERRGKQEKKTKKSSKHTNTLYLVLPYVIPIMVLQHIQSCYRTRLPSLGPIG